MANVKVDRRLYVTGDRKTLVEDGDSRAAFLWSPGAGYAVSEEEAERVGYSPDKAAAARYEKKVSDSRASTQAPDLTQLVMKPKDAGKPDDKNTAKPEDKMAGKPGTK